MAHGPQPINGLVKHVRVALTSAQLLALATTPVTLIPALAPGRYPTALTLNFSFTFGTIAYTGSGPIVFVGSTSGSAVTVAFSGVTLTSNNMSVVRSEAFTNVVTSAVSGQPLILAVTGTPLAAGNGTLVIDAWYVEGNV